jgi:hypothetical protein
MCRAVCKRQEFVPTHLANDTAISGFDRKYRKYMQNWAVVLGVDDLLRKAKENE